jgi:hypothetical protein
MRIQPGLLAPVAQRGLTRDAALDLPVHELWHDVQREALEMHRCIRDQRRPVLQPNGGGAPQVALPARLESPDLVTAPIEGSRK